MAGPTFSLTFTGTGHNAAYASGNELAPVFQLDDTNSVPGIQALRMSQNGQVNALIGGGARKCTIDASRSDPSKNLIFLLPV